MLLFFACVSALCGEGLAKTLAVCAGSVTTLSGSLDGRNGHADGPAKSALFYHPNGVASNGADTIYVADKGNNLIRAVAQSTGAVLTFVGGGYWGIGSGDADGIGTNAQFDQPTGVTLDNQGNLFIADSGNCMIRQVALSNGSVTTLAGGGGGYPLPFCGNADGTGTHASFFVPLDVATHSDNLFVADSYSDRIRRIAISTALVTRFVGGNKGSNDGIGTQASFRYPCALALDASGGTLYISDSDNNLIRMADTRTAVVTTLAGGTSSRSIDGVGTAASFSFPHGVALDSSGNLFVVEYHGRVRVIDLATATVYTIAGSVSPFGFVDGLGSAAVFHGPIGIAIGFAGKLFLGDQGNNVIRAIDAPCTQTALPAGPLVPVGTILGCLAAAVVLIASGIVLFINRKPILAWTGAHTKLPAADEPLIALGDVSL
jgi:hypothetical protein